MSTDTFDIDKIFKRKYVDKIKENVQKFNWWLRF